VKMSISQRETNFDSKGAEKEGVVAIRGRNKG